MKPSIASTQSSTAGSVTKKAKKTPLKESPHVLIWVCAAGKGRGKSWGKALKCVGVYATKQAAEEKKTQLMGQYLNAGHGDILVGDSWEDEIDLVVKPVEDMAL